jgi:hypothetical protein
LSQKQKKMVNGVESEPEQQNPREAVAESEETEVSGHRGHYSQ